MMFSKLPVVALAALATVAGAIPTGGSSPTCASSTVQCCQTVTPTSEVDGGLLTIIKGLLGVLVDASVNVANGCVPISVLGGNCNQQTVCCENLAQHGLINIGLNCVQVA